MLLMKVSKCWKIVEFPKISIKMKNFKTFYEDQTKSLFKEIIQPTTRYKLPRSLKQILSYRDTVYRNIQIFVFKCFENAVLGHLRMVQCKCFFSDTKQEHVFWKICKVSGFYCESIFFTKSSQNEWGFLSKTALHNEWFFSLVFVRFETFY